MQGKIFKKLNVPVVNFDSDIQYKKLSWDRVVWRNLPFSHMRVKLLDFPISFSPSLEEKQTAEMFTRPESDRVVYWKRHYHGLETSAFVFFVGRVTTMNRIDMSFEVRLSVNRLSISSVQNRAVTFKIWSEVLLQSRGGLCFTFIIAITCACC